MSSTSTAQLRPSTQSFTFPQYLAFGAAVLLAIASAATNVGSAIARHPDMLGKAVSASIALAVTGLLLVAMPACISAIRGRHWTIAALAALAWTMAAAFSISAALGTLGKPRLESSIHKAEDDRTRARLEAERKRATNELSTLAPARPATELNGIIAAKLATPGANQCIKVDGQISARICKEVADLQSEASRSTRMSALSGTITRVDADLTKLGKPTIASPDAAAIVAVLTAFGIIATVDTLNVILLLIGVAILEIGPGIAAALAVGMRAVAGPVVMPMKDMTPAAHSVAVEAVAAVSAANVPIIVQTPVAPTGSVAVQAASKIITLVKDAGGQLTVASRRELASLVGTSSPSVGRALALIGGAVAVTATADGLVIRLAA